MSELTVFLAPSGVSDGVLAALTDLSAAGLLEEFAWIADPGDADLSEVFLVTGGVGADTPLGALAASRRTALLRVCTVVPAFDGHRRLPVPAERTTTARLQAATGAGRVARTRILLARGTRLAGEPEELAVDGWHNVLLAPEDARGPGYGAVAWNEDDGAAELGRFAAPGIAALTGLWQGVRHAPLDEQEPLPGHVLRLARSFYRRLDTDGVEDRLRAAVLAQGGALPVPSDQGSQIVQVGDVGAATSAMAGSLWRKHGWVLRGPRLPYPSQATEHIGPWQVIKMFLAFMWASLKNAPAAWARSMVDNVSSRIAVGTQQLVFDGAPVAYEVVVNGRTASGGYAGWAEVGAATAQLTGAVTGSGENQLGGNDDLSAVWQDYARGAMTLADAGQRSVDLPPLKMGPTRAVVSAVADLVPGPAERFTGLPGAVAAAVGTDGVDATDPLGIVDLENRLGELQRHPDLALPAKAALGDLSDWKRRGSRSYGVAVGQQLARAFYDVRSEVQSLLGRVTNPPRLPEDDTAQSATFIRWVQIVIMLLTGLGLAAALIVAEARDPHNHVLRWVMVTGIVTALLALLVAIGMIVGGGDGNKDDQNSAFGRWIQVVVVLFLVFVEVAILLVYYSVHAWWTTLLVCLGVLVVLLVIGATSFISTQRRVFALLHQRRTVTSQFEIDKQNLATALRDLRRLTSAYGQYLSWSRSVGAFLQAPLGPDRSHGREQLQLGWGLPMSTGFATVEPDEPAVDEVAGYVRHQLFHPGWLTGPWENLVISALPPVPGAADRGADLSPFWRDPGFGTRSSLDRWSTDLYQGRVQSTGADLVWRNALGLLNGPMNSLVPRLVGTVTQVGGATMPVGEFLVGLDDGRGGPDGAAASGGVFGPALFTDGARASGATRVEAPDVRHSRHVGLGMVAVVTQFSTALDPDQLRNAGAAAQPEWSGSAPAAPGGTGAADRVEGGSRPDPFRVPEFGAEGGF